MIWWHDGLRPEDDIRIDPGDRGFLLGDGVFETIRAAMGEPMLLDRHLARLRAGADFLGIPIPFDADTIHAACIAVLRSRDLEAGVLRLTLTRGVGPRGLHAPASPRPTFLIVAHPERASLPPARLIVARSTRRNVYSPTSRFKTLNYLDPIIARREAAERGADDAVLLGTGGLVACASGSSLLVRINGAWLTPRVEDGALPGVARGRLLERGDIAEAAISLEMLAQADRLRLINALGQREVLSLTI